MQTRVASILDALERAPVRELGSFIRGMTAISGLRKSSRMLASHLVMDVLQLDDPRLLVLTAALYLEHITGSWSERSKKTKRSDTLAVKLDALLHAGEIDVQLHGDLRAAVRLRNQYAHNLFFHLSDWDPLTSPSLAHHKPKLPGRRNLRALKNLALLKILLFDVAARLQQSLPWLALEDVPKAYRVRGQSVIDVKPSLAF